MEPFCRVDAILKIIGDRWTLGIIHELSGGPRRTLDLYKSFEGLSTKTMTDRLRALERNRLVIRISYKESPPRVEYSLTENGRHLLPVIDSLAKAYAELFGDAAETGSEGCKCCSNQIEVCVTQREDRRIVLERPQTIESNPDPNQAPHSAVPKKRRPDITLL